MENPAENVDNTNAGIKQQLPDSAEGITETAANGRVILETDVDKIVLVGDSDSSETKMKGDISNIGDVSERTLDDNSKYTSQQNDQPKAYNTENVDNKNSGNNSTTENGDNVYETNAGNGPSDVNKAENERDKDGKHANGDDDDELSPMADDDYDVVDGLLKLKKIFCGKGRKEDQDDPPYMPAGKFDKIYLEEEIKHQYRPASQRTHSHSKEVTPESIHRGITRQLSQPKTPPQRDRGKYSLKERTNRRVMSKVDSDHYYFGHLERGYMLVIINDTFTHQSPRDGAINDLRNMRAIARKFGFRILNYRYEMNLTKPDVIYWLERARMQDQSDCDCFAFMISTHGYEQKNALVGGKEDHALVCADDQIIFTSSVTRRFSDDMCPSLKSKPKFFFIQACRGENLDQGANVYVLQTHGVDKTCSATLDDDQYRRAKSVDMCDTKLLSDSWRTADHRHDPYSMPQDDTRYMTQMKKTMDQNWNPAQQNSSHNPQSAPHHTKHHKVEPVSSRAMPHVTPGKPSAQTSYAIVDTPSIHCDNDMLVMYAIPPGFFAWRNSMDGSWMIHYLNKVLMAYDFQKPKNFLSLLTKVNAQMSERTTNAPKNKKLHEKKAVSVLEHKLTRDVIFEQKVAMSHWKKMAL